MPTASPRAPSPTYARCLRGRDGSPTGTPARRTVRGRQGYFAPYVAGGLLPGFLLGTLLSPTWDGTPADGFDTGGDGGDSGIGRLG